MSEHIGQTTFAPIDFSSVSGWNWTPTRVPIVPVAPIRSPLQQRLDEQASHVAVLDGFGNLLWVNRAWRQFAENSGLVDPTAGVGMNYLLVCDRAQGTGAYEAKIVASGIRDVIAGTYSSVYFRYGFDCPVQRNLFSVRVTRVSDEEVLRVIVAHERIL